jgi:predicted methyltransferase
MAERIIELNIDERLRDYDKTLVNELAKVEIKGKTKNFYSFATKYCSHHNPTQYPIYDSYVHKILTFFQNQDDFYGSKLPDFKVFDDFRNVLLQFRDFYILTEFDLLQLDRYLWQLGKESFPKNYKKKKSS